MNQMFHQRMVTKHRNTLDYGVMVNKMKKTNIMRYGVDKLVTSSTSLNEILELKEKLEKDEK